MSSIDPAYMMIHALVFLALVASGAGLLACILYRRVSGAMPLLILACAADVVVTFLSLALGLANQFLWDNSFDNINWLYVVLNFLNFATVALTAVGFFMVFADVARRQDRPRDRGPDDDFDRRPSRYDDRDEPRWGRDPGGPDIRR